MLMGHGSADREGAEEFVQVVEAVRAESELPVEAGFLEFFGPVLPSIGEAMDAVAASGAERVLAVPVLLFYAGHAKYDMPGQIVAGRERHPRLDLRAAPPFGTQEPLLEIIEQRIRELEERLGSTAREETAVLLVGRGTSDPEANADFYKIGRLIWERNECAAVECCFIAMTQPGVPEGIERCVRLGARRVLVVPYFINTGVLVKRIEQKALAAREQYPGVEIGVGEHFHAHPKLVRLILDRARALAEQAEDALDMLSERTCLYRCAAASRHHHHEHEHVHAGVEG